MRQEPSVSKETPEVCGTVPEYVGQLLQGPLQCLSPVRSHPVPSLPCSSGR